LERIVTNELTQPKEEEKLSFSGKVYRKLFQSAVSSMRKGSMRFVEPGDEGFVLGDPSSPFPAYHNALIQVNRPNDFYRRTVLLGDIGFSEAYLDGDWDTDSITNVLSWFLLNVDSGPATSGSKEFKPHIKLMNFFNRMYHLYRSNSVKGSKRNIVEHYDLGNDFYKLFLDKTMTYSSAYFQKDETSLEEAQVAKYEALCKHLHLKSEHHLLEIGSGWGGFSLYVAMKYGCRITTITISDEQYKYAKELFKRHSVDHLIDIKLMDYRKLEGKFDRIVSIEMLEAVGDKYLETYFQKCQSVLKQDGLLALQVITSPDSRYEEFKTGIDFIQKHIFPGSLLPSIGRMNLAINRTGDMHLYHMHDMGLSYAKTLKLWLDMFDKNIAQVRSLGFGEKFIRTWRYYLSYCEAAFKMRNISVVQVVYTRPNNLSI